MHILDHADIGVNCHFSGFNLNTVLEATCQGANYLELKKPCLCEHQTFIHFGQSCVIDNTVQTGFVWKSCRFGGLAHWLETISCCHTVVFTPYDVWKSCPSIKRWFEKDNGNIYYSALFLFGKLLDSWMTVSHQRMNAPIGHISAALSRNNNVALTQKKETGSCPEGMKTLKTKKKYIRIRICLVIQKYAWFIILNIWYVWLCCRSVLERDTDP